MLTKNKKNSFKTQAALMTLGTLAPMAPAMMTNVGNIVAHADTFAFKDGTTVSGGQEGVPMPQRLTTPSDEATQVKITPFTWTIRVVNQQTGQQLKSDDITFTPKSDTVTVNQKTGANEVHYTVTDTAGIFKSSDYTVPDGDINFNDIISKTQARTTDSNSISRGGANNTSQDDNNTFPTWIFGAKDSDGLTPYILPELNNNTTAQQTAQVSGDADHKVLTFYVIPNTAQTKNKNNANNSGSYVVSATGQDTGNNTATANGSSSTTNTSSNTNNGSATHNNSTNANKTNNAGNSNQQSSQQDADTQQIINYINQHAEQKVNIASDAKLLTSFPAGENDAISWAANKGFDQYTVWTKDKAHFVDIYYNPQTKQFFATEDSNEHTLLTKAQLLQLFGLQSKDGNAAGTNGVLGSGSLGGTPGSATGGLAQTNVQTKQNVSILLSAIAGTAILGFGLTKDGKLKL